MSDFKDELKKKLIKDGAVSSSDLGSFGKEAVPEEKPEPVEENSKVAVDPSVYSDPFVQAGTEPAHGEDLGVSVGMDQPNDEYLFGSTQLEEVEVTQEDKEAFLDAVVNDARFERPFSLFNGRVNGTFRSRTNGESRAIIMELHRQWAVREYLPTSEHTNLMKCGMLRMQLKELNGVQYPEAEEPLIATFDFKDKEAKPPRWFKEMETITNNMSDAMVVALYTELVEFEKVYWTLVKNAHNQNFWLPEDSTSA